MTTNTVQLTCDPIGAPEDAIVAVATVLDANLITVASSVLHAGRPRVLNVPTAGSYTAVFNLLTGEESTTACTITGIDETPSRAAYTPDTSSTQETRGEPGEDHTRPQWELRLWTRAGNTWQRAQIEATGPAADFTVPHPASTDTADTASVELSPVRGTPLMTMAPQGARLRLTQEQDDADPVLALVPDSSGAVALLSFLHRSDLASARIVAADMLTTCDAHECGLLNGLALAYFFCRTRANDQLNTWSAALTTRFPRSADAHILRARAGMRTATIPGPEVRSYLLFASMAGPPVASEGLHLLADALRRFARDAPAHDPITQASHTMQRYLGAALSNPLTCFRGTNPSTPVIHEHHTADQPHERARPGRPAPDMTAPPHGTRPTLADDEIDHLLHQTSGPPPERSRQARTKHAHALLRADPTSPERFTATLTITPAQSYNPPTTWTTIGLKTSDQHILASLTPNGTATFTDVPAGDWSLRRIRRRPLQPADRHIFGLPLPTAPAELAAAPGIDDTAVLMSATSPDRRARFTLHPPTDDDYRLEVNLLHPPTKTPSIVTVRYGRLPARDETLLIPLTRAAVGPPTSIVRLAGYDTSSPWQASEPTPPHQISIWEPTLIAASIHAATTPATKRAWRDVASHLPATTHHLINEQLPPR